MAQIFPATDSFATNGVQPNSPNSAGVYEFHTGYLRARPPTFSTTISANTYSWSPSSFNLVDAYSTSSTSGRVASLCELSVASPNFTSPSRTSTGMFLWRQYFDDDCVVSALFSHRVLSGAQTSRGFKTAGVVARYSAPSIAGASGSGYFLDGNGYAFVLMSDPVNGDAHRFLLLRFNGASVTVLASASASSSLSGFTRSSLLAGITLKLSAQTVAGNVELTCSAKRSSTASAFVTVLSATDSSGSKVTANGRAGFIMGGYDDLALNPLAGEQNSYSTTLCHWFQIYDTATSSYHMRDEWQRYEMLGRTSSTPTVTGPWVDANGASGLYASGLSGRNLASLYQSQDGYASASTSRNLWSINGSNVAINNSTSLSFGAHNVYRCKNFYASDRSLDIKFESAVAIQNVWIFARASVESSATNPIHLNGARSAVSCYKLRMQIGSTAGGNLTRLFIDDISSSGGVQTIAQMPSAIALGTGIFTGLSLSNFFTLRFKVYNDPNTNPPQDANVKMAVYINGTQVLVPLVSPPVAGVSIDVDGLTLVDSRAASTIWGRKVGGWYEGFEVSPQNTTTSNSFRNWSDLYVSTGVSATRPTPPGPFPVQDTEQGDLGENDMATIALNSECVGKTGTLTVPYDWGVQEQAKAEAIVAPFEAGYRVRSVRHTRQRRRWTIRANAITDSERTTLLNFWTSHKGAEIPFDWVDPETGATVAVRFADDSLGVTLANPAVRQFEFILEEVFC